MAITKTSPSVAAWASDNPQWTDTAADAAMANARGIFLDVRELLIIFSLQTYEVPRKWEGSVRK
ncbi:MAG TPA: hypothetical protein VH518_05930 [Tepidisphaeraceae bacterium]